jgi:ribosomal protein S18 acetylase RimI-like enzyme
MITITRDFLVDVVPVGKLPAGFKADLDHFKSKGFTSDRRAVVSGSSDGSYNLVHIPSRTSSTYTWPFSIKKLISSAGNDDIMYTVKRADSSEVVALAVTARSWCNNACLLRIKTFLVHDDYQSMGLGRFLLESIEGRFFSSGGAAVELSANSYNSRAIRLYTSSGYSPVDVMIPAVKLVGDDVEIVFEKKTKLKG